MSVKSNWDIELDAGKPDDWLYLVRTVQENLCKMFYNLHCPMDNQNLPVVISTLNVAHANKKLYIKFHFI